MLNRLKQYGTPSPERMKAKRRKKQMPQAALPKRMPTGSQKLTKEFMEKTRRERMEADQERQADRDRWNSYRIKPKRKPMGG